jgi:hypothetical protein
MPLVRNANDVVRLYLVGIATKILGVEVETELPIDNAVFKLRLPPFGLRSSSLPTIPFGDILAADFDAIEVIECVTSNE